jgi:hypothetical protein
LRELSEEAEVDEVEFVPTQFSGENEEQSKKNRKSTTHCIPRSRRRTQFT